MRVDSGVPLRRAQRGLGSAAAGPAGWYTDRVARRRLGGTPLCGSTREATLSRRGEFLLLSRDRAVVTAAALFADLCSVALSSGIRWHQAESAKLMRAAQNEKVEFAERRRLAEGYWVHPPPPLAPVLLDLHDPTSAYVVGQAGRIVSIPLPKMAATAIGQFDFLPLLELISITPRQRRVADEDGLENPLRLMTGRFDLAFVVVYFLPLLVVALTYNLVSLEREQGTQALLRSQPIHVPLLLRVTAALRARVLVLIASITMLPFALAGEGLRVGCWILTVANYAAFWTGLSLWVGS